MRKYALLGMLLLFIFLVGCAVNYESPSSSDKNVEVKETVGNNGLKLIEERYDAKVYEIDCKEIYSKLDLFYFLSQSDEPSSYYVYLPTNSLKQDKYTLRAKEQLNNEYLNTGGSYCTKGSGVGENINYWYCNKISILTHEISDSGVVLSSPNIRVKTVWDVDDNLERIPNPEKHQIATDGKLISEECTIEFPKLS